jgi:hypothetical protein
MIFISEWFMLKSSSTFLYQKERNAALFGMTIYLRIYTAVSRSSLSHYLPPLPGAREGVLPPLPLLLLPEFELGVTLGEEEGALLPRSKVLEGLLSLLLSTERRGLVSPGEAFRGFT